MALVDCVECGGAEFGAEFGCCGLGLAEFVGEVTSVFLVGLELASGCGYGVETACHVHLFG